VLQHLGAAYVRADQPDDAREAWQRAVRMFEILGDDKQAARIRSDLEELGPSQDTGVR
jgi:hypothetical protein